VLVDLDDGSGIAPLPGSTPYEEAVATTVTEPLPTASPDDLYLVCTGGTTGRPKAVLWRQADIYLSAMAGAEGATAESIAGGARAWQAGPWYAVPPLMHAAAQWTAFCGLHCGAPVLLHDDSQPFDPAVVLGNAERERAFLLSIVGDAYAGPLVDELRRRPYDLASLVTVGTGGAATGDQHKAALVELLPHLTIMDGYGASETGGMAFGPRTKDRASTSFVPSTGAAVASADRTRFLEPGDDEVGWIARRARVPLGYLGDRDATETTFPIIDGERVAIPGDRGRLLADGSIALLGRDSMVVNSGGEKVYVEEVEAVLRTHPDVADALVVGRPSDRFGQEVVALVAARPGATLVPAELRAFVGGEIARFKAPRAVAVVDVVQRLANGKADYAWARETAASAVAATEAS
jgi:fatty-acyl-CoA synthase